MKLHPILRDWKLYHKFSSIDNFRFSLYFMKKRAFKIFSKESKQDFYSAKRLLEKCFTFPLDGSSKLFFTSSKSFIFTNHKSFWVDYNLNSTTNSNFRKFFICVHCGISL